MVEKCACNVRHQNIFHARRPAGWTNTTHCINNNDNNSNNKGGKGGRGGGGGVVCGRYFLRCHSSTATSAATLVISTNALCRNISNP